MSTVKVKRNGPRGYHIIDRAKYDANPSAFELYEAPAVDQGEAEKVAAAEAAAKAKEDAAKAAKLADPLADLPEDWRNASGRGIAKIKAIAEAATGRTAGNMVEAVQMIDAVLAERAKVPPPPPLVPPPV